VLNVMEKEEWEHLDLVNQEICISRQIVQLAGEVESMMEDPNVLNVMEKEEWELLDLVKVLHQICISKINAPCAREVVTFHPMQD